MKYAPLSIDVNLRPEAFVVHLDSLFAALATLSDRLDARGLRYALVTMLVYVLLAKLAGEDHLRGIAQWAALHKEDLASVPGFVHCQRRCLTTCDKGLDVVTRKRKEWEVHGQPASESGNQAMILPQDEVI